jgi:hypothetical protein
LEVKIEFSQRALKFNWPLGLSRSFYQCGVRTLAGARTPPGEGPDIRLPFVKEAKMLRFQNILPVLAFVAVTGTNFSAYAGPCTAQIAQVEQQIDAAGANSKLGATSAQTVGAQLGRQPTPQTVQDTCNEHRASSNSNDLASARSPTSVG